MKRCNLIAPLLPRVAEREARPDEALEVARHVEECTACRIRLAREHRLQQLLDDPLDSLPSAEDFVADVMSHIPAEPPPRPRPRKRRRGIQLA